MVIGLCGYKGSGKSTAADWLVKEHGFRKINFKDALVEEMKLLYPDTLKQIALVYGVAEDELFDLKPAVMRALMQNHGTEIRRAQNPNHWVDQWIEKIKHTTGNIVTDDVRFANEQSALSEGGGVLVRIVRKGQQPDTTHVSEREHENFKEDFTLEIEDGDIKQLYNQIDNVINTIKGNVD